MVAFDLAKVDVRVRFPLPAPISTGDLHNGSAEDFESSCRGSIPLSPANLFGVYCQLGDGLIWSQEAAGASPVTPTNLMMCVLGIDSNSVRVTIQPCMSDPDESGPDRVGLIFNDYINKIYIINDT